MEDKELIARLIELDGEVKTAEATVNKLKEERDELKKQVMPIFERMGVRSLKSGNKSIYLLRQIWAGPKNVPAEVVTALEALGLNSMVSYNSMSLASYVREIAREHGLTNEDGNIIGDEEKILSVLPPQLKDVLKISEKIDVRVRKT